MKKLVACVIVGMLLCAPIVNAANYGAVPAPGPPTTQSPGPAPNSGDGISDGSGFEEDDLSIMGNIMEIFFGPGPAPNSGDGIPDGSGFESPPKGEK